jgi:hypothetical protein
MNIRWTLISTLLLVRATAQAAAAPDVTDIVQRANRAAYYAGKDGKAAVTMKLSDGRIREFVILRRNADTGDDQSFYVYFTAPADVLRMTYLVHKHPGGEDDRWLFLPALNLVKRIAPGDKRTSFAGSDFLYEDVSGRGLEEDTHTLIETTETQYVVKNVPRKPASVEFSAYTVWIDKDTYIPRKAEYLDHSGKLYRRVVATQVERIQGYPTVTESRVEDLNAGSSTMNTFRTVTYDIGLDPNVFTERFLRRPPREVTR